MPLHGIRYAETYRPRDLEDLGQVQSPRNSTLSFQMRKDMLGSITISAISSRFLIKNKLSPLFLFTALPQFSSKVKIERDARSICLNIPNAFESIIRVNIL